MSELMKTSEVCEMLRVSRATVSRMVHDGRLKPTYTPTHGWRFDRAVVEAMTKTKEDEAHG